MAESRSVNGRRVGEETFSLVIALELLLSKSFTFNGVRSGCTRRGSSLSGSLPFERARGAEGCVMGTVEEGANEFGERAREGGEIPSLGGGLTDIAPGRALASISGRRNEGGPRPATFGWSGVWS